ncbi:cellulase-like family protein [Flavitalea antarctica]
MKRKDFIMKSALTSMAVLAGQAGFSKNFNNRVSKIAQPRAITMWDFSWLERRWPGGSYEDWDKVLDELLVRGYNAIRIDAYPHLLAEDPAKEWTLLPVWDQQDWGSPGKINVSVYPSLKEFMQKCKNRDIKIGLSTWYREDVNNVRSKVNSPEKMAEIWIKTLDLLAKDSLLDTILYVDLCNEWTSVWSVMFTEPSHNWGTVPSLNWMKKSIQLVKDKYPQLPLTFSFDYSGDDVGDKLRKNPLPHFDLIEQHIWMASLNKGEFNNTVGYNWHKFSSESYKNLIEKGEKLYRSKPDYWKKLLVDQINLFAAASKDIQMPLISTECWAIVDYKDFPGLNWNWVKDLCELGVSVAAGTGQWVSIASSNFCGPQFVGMWSDVEWHKRITKIIKSSSISPQLHMRKIINRLL